MAFSEAHYCIIPLHSIHSREFTKSTSYGLQHTTLQRTHNMGLTYYHTA